jgi:nardilysin
MTSVTRLAEVCKPERDEKAYRRCRLANGAEVLLISDVTLTGAREGDDGDMDDDVDDGASRSDEGSGSDGEEEGSVMDYDDEDEEASGGGGASGGGMKLAACSIAFNVGYFADSVECDGLSHFLEHMVFMGSEKYPGENYFGEWLNEHWGSDNASTDSENTIFYFECNPKNLREALDIFSGFFLNPLVKLDSVEREVTAVESEFERVINNDTVRAELLLSSLAREGHPFTKFGWGNRASLTQSAPYKEGRMRDVLLEHWRKHYHAKRMSIAIVGAEELDVLEGWIDDIFGDMRGDGDAAIDLSVAESSPYASVVPMRVLTTQVKDGQHVSITHELPGVDADAIQEQIGKLP